MRVISQIIDTLQCRIFFQDGVLTLQHLMKANDEPMALWFLLQIIIIDLYNLKISFQCICMYQRAKQSAGTVPLPPSTFRDTGRLLKTGKAEYRD
jgi:hypothetical protein